MDGDSWFVDLVEALAVPLAIVAVIAILHRPIADALGGLAGRVSKLSVGGLFAVELTTVPETRPDWSFDFLAGPVDVRGLTPANAFDSFADSLLRQLEQPGALDFLLVDLEDGQAWLASRLFLFADILQAERDLRCVVLVRRTPDGRRTMVGFAAPGPIRWSLAQEFPWFEVGAGAGILVGLSDGAARWSVHRVRQWRPRTSVGGFRRSSLPGGVAATGSARASGRSWAMDDAPASRPTPAIWERASWLDERAARRVLGSVLHDDHVDEPQGGDVSREEQVRAVVAKSGEFVAVLRDGDFDRLLDRRAIVESVATHVVRSLRTAGSTTAVAPRRTSPVRPGRSTDPLAPQCRSIPTYDLM